ncbi:MAG: hypothetical protein IJZ21_05745 [Clostridia bacterium]|nr:hypothetical protein [Clostridia bacterium]
MNEKIKKITQNPKLLIVLGIGGILLIFISSLFSADDKTDNKAASSSTTYTTEEYSEMLEKDIKNIVTGITGDKNPTVVITLESGIRYSYASADETDTSSSAGSANDQSSESKKQSYITVKTADGGEQALIVTEIMPEVRGVAIICAGGNSETTAEKIKNAVTAALNITSKRVYISGGTRE